MLFFMSEEIISESGAIDQESQNGANSDFRVHSVDGVRGKKSTNLP